MRLEKKQDKQWILVSLYQVVRSKCSKWCVLIKQKENTVRNGEWLLIINKLHTNKPTNFLTSFRTT